MCDGHNKCNWTGGLQTRDLEGIEVTGIIPMLRTRQSFSETLMQDDVVFIVFVGQQVSHLHLDAQQSIAQVSSWAGGKSASTGCVSSKETSQLCCLRIDVAFCESEIEWGPSNFMNVGIV